MLVCLVRMYVTEHAGYCSLPGIFYVQARKTFRLWPGLGFWVLCKGIDRPLPLGALDRKERKRSYFFRPRGPAYIYILSGRRRLELERFVIWGGFLGFWPPMKEKFFWGQSQPRQPTFFLLEPQHHGGLAAPPLVCCFTVLLRGTTSPERHCCHGGGDPNNGKQKAKSGGEFFGIGSWI